MDSKVIKIGTRGSALALAQTELVISAVKRCNPDACIEKVIIKTKGDKEADKPVASFGGKGVFITEIEEALSCGKIDMAVHSAKDLPASLSEGLHIPSVLERQDARDVFITRAGTSYIDLFQKEHPVVGTGSLRRQFQLQSHHQQYINFKHIRGNVPTRLEKLRNREYDGIILAAAGLKRLGLEAEKDFEYKYFDIEEMVPAAGQGIIAIETRKEDCTSGGSYISSILKDITDYNTFIHYCNERKIMEALHAGCHEAIGIISYYYNNNRNICIKLIRETGSARGVVSSYNGKGSIDDMEELVSAAIEHGRGGCQT
ncbi:MAG: hydroxymethylbilane synthase [Lachnospiraceae bacterium]|jgi:porphobilinogen deaminase|nr:hydroxymethylbilane synthase [Lachnospiraceae bacterium]